MNKAVLGIIGGSGLYDLPGLEDVREERVSTPWGEPSDALRIGRAGTAVLLAWVFFQAYVAGRIDDMQKAAPGSFLMHNHGTMH